MNQKVSRRALAQVVTAKLLAEPGRRDHWLKALAAYLIEYKMADDMDLIVNDIAHELFVARGELLVEVTSARPLTGNTAAELKKYLAAQTKAKEVVLTERTDPSLVGGFIARTPSQELNASVRATLNQLATIN